MVCNLRQGDSAVRSAPVRAGTGRAAPEGFGRSRVRDGGRRIALLAAVLALAACVGAPGGYQGSGPYPMLPPQPVPEAPVYARPSGTAVYQRPGYPPVYAPGTHPPVYERPGGPDPRRPYPGAAYPAPSYPTTGYPPPGNYPPPANYPPPGGYPDRGGATRLPPDAYPPGGGYGGQQQAARPGEERPRPGHAPGQAPGQLPPPQSGQGGQFGQGGQWGQGGSANQPAPGQPAGGSAARPIPGRDAPQAARPPGRCNAGPASSVVGKRTAQSVVLEAQQKSGANAVRVVKPNEIKPDDYNGDRLNLVTGEGQTIVRVECG